jgi:hypothetical protein
MFHTFMWARPPCFNPGPVLVVHIGNFVIQFDDFVLTYLWYYIFFLLSVYFFLKKLYDGTAP